MQSNYYKSKVTFYECTGNNPDTDEPIYKIISSHYCNVQIKGTGEPLFNKDGTRISSYTTTLVLRKTNTSLKLNTHLFFKYQNKLFNIINIIENDNNELVIESTRNL